MSVKLTVLWKGNGSAGASPQALADLVSGNVVQGVIQQSGRAAAVTLKRDDLEKLLAARSGGARSALQAVKDAYAEIGMMREEGVSWAEIAELLAQNGAVGRDGKPFGAATVRAAFFLVGAEVRQGQLGDDLVPDSFAEPLPDAEPLDTEPFDVEPPEATEEGPAAYEPAELPPLPPLRTTEPEAPLEPKPEPVSESAAEPVFASAAEPESEEEESPLPAPEVATEPEPEPAPEPVSEPEAVWEPDVAAMPEPVESAAAMAEAPIAELIPEDEAAAEVVAEPESEPDSPPLPLPPVRPAPRPSALPRGADMWLHRIAAEPAVEILPEDEPVAPVVVRTESEPASEPEPLPAAAPSPPVTTVTAPATPSAKSPFTHEVAMTYDWWARRIDSST